MFPILNETVLGKVKLADPGPVAACLAVLLRAGVAECVEPLEPDVAELWINGLRDLEAGQFDTDC